MQTININKLCCLSGPLKLNWKKRWAKISERGMVNFLNRFKGWVVGGTLFPLALLVACKSKQVQKPPVPVKVATVELHAANSGARYSATIIPRTQVELAFKVDGYAEAAYEKAKLDFDRAQTLFTSQSLTKANYDAANAQFEQATAKAAAARS